MNTALVFGNGNLLVNVNEHLDLSDLYWPHVGQENHLAQRPNEVFFRINGKETSGIDGNWKVSTSYLDDSLVSDSIMTHKTEGVQVRVRDCVLPDKDAFIRSFEIENLSDSQKEVYVYIKNNFYMLEDDVGNTAVWDPRSQLMVHYKKNRYVGVGSTGNIHQFTCAAPNDNHGRGAVPNDKGELHYNPVTTGSAQSNISYRFEIKSNEKAKFDSFIVCGNNFDDTTKLAELIRKKGSDQLVENTDIYWKNWVRSKVVTLYKDKKPKLFGDERDKKVFELYKRSLLIIRTHFDNGGAIIAANDSTFLKAGGKDTYSYFWPRDGAMVSEALIDAGVGDLVKKFFRYCKDILDTDGYILHKYYPDISSGLASSWHPWIDSGGNFQLPIQEDETALVLHALWKHHERFGDQEFLNEMWGFINKAADFLVKYRYSEDFESFNISAAVEGFEDRYISNPLDSDYQQSGLPRPSYGIWEIERGIFSYTVATVFAGLNAAAKLAESHGDLKLRDKYNKVKEEILESTNKHLYAVAQGRFLKVIRCDPVEEVCVRDDSIDAQFFALWRYGMYDINDPRIESTMREVEEKLWVDTKVGGIARKENDWYHREDDSLQGNPWFICTLWMAQYWLNKGEPEKAKRYVTWVLDHTDHTGLMAEQADPHHGVARSVKPLTWSHAEFVRTVNLLQI
ncbi:MAG: glycoside hydrolase family 15 protein [Candidatus Dojkabacteria bacterium]